MPTSFERYAHRLSPEFCSPHILECKRREWGRLGAYAARPADGYEACALNKMDCSLRLWPPSSFHLQKGRFVLRVHKKTRRAEPSLPFPFFIPSRKSDRHEAHPWREHALTTPRLPVREPLLLKHMIRAGPTCGAAVIPRGECLFARPGAAVLAHSTFVRLTRLLHKFCRQDPAFTTQVARKMQKSSTRVSVPPTALPCSAP